MKMTIKRVLNCVILATSMLLGVACSAEPMFGDMVGDGGYNATFGVLEEGAQTIVADNGTILHIVELGNQTSSEELNSKQGRVLFNYTILGNNPAGGFNIRLNRFYPLEVKDLEIYAGDADHSSGVQSVADWKDEDFVSLLEAPAMPYEVSIGGGYININVCYTSTISPDEEMPDVELYYDATCSTGDTAVLQLVCEREEEMYERGARAYFRWFSFRISKEIEVLTSETNIYAFHWCWWVEDGNPSAGIMEQQSVMNTNHYGSSSDRAVKPMVLN